MNANLRTALLLLGAGFLLAVIGIVVLAVTEHPIPDVLQNVAVGAMTAVGALLTRVDPRPPAD